LSDTHACCGGCNHHWRQAQTAFKAALDEWAAAGPTGRGPKPEQPTIRPVLGDPVWCHRCTARIRLSLAEIDDLAAIYAAASDGHRAPGNGDKVTGSKGAPSPSPTADDLDELYSVLADWEAAYRGNDWRAHRGALAPAITTVVAWLGTHIDGILAHPDIAPEFGRDVLQWHRHLVHRTKAGTGVHAKRTPCPRCDCMSLTWREGDEYVRCSNIDCQRLLNLDDYDAVSAEYARSAMAS